MLPNIDQNKKAIAKEWKELDEQQINDAPLSEGGADEDDMGKLANAKRSDKSLDRDEDEHI